jgi:hypothetical protein
MAGRLGQPEISESDAGVEQQEGKDMVPKRKEDWKLVNEQNIFMTKCVISFFFGGFFLSFEDPNQNEKQVLISIHLVIRSPSVSLSSTCHV